jgi:hypothetical protein
MRKNPKITPDNNFFLIKMSDEPSRVSMSTLVAYGLLFGVTAKVWLTEIKDLSCPSFSATKEECEKSGGMPFADTLPEPGDSIKTLKNRTSKAMKHDSSAIKWRRAFVLSVVIMIGLSILLFQKILPWQTFYLGALTCFAIIFGHFTWYSYHVSRDAESRGLQSLENLYKKIKDSKRDF